MLPLPVCQCGTTLFVLSTRRLRPRTNAKRLCATSTRWFDRRAERRTDVGSRTRWGHGHIKKVRSSLSRLAEVQRAAPFGRSIAMERNPLTPKQRSGEHENPIKGVLDMGSGFDARFPYRSEGSTDPAYAVRWDYVGRHAADDDRPVTPHRLSGGQVVWQNISHK